MKLKFFLNILVGLFFVGILIVVGIKYQHDKKMDDVDFTKIQVSVVGYKTQLQSIAEKIYFVGTLEADKIVEIKSDLDGLVEKINFNEGQKVKKGDALVFFNQEKINASLQQAKANLKLAKLTHDRYKTLVNNGAISRMDFDQATNVLEVNQAIVNAAMVELNSTIIRAPFDGVIGKRLINEGQFISRGDSLGFINNQELMKVDFRAPEKYLSQLKTGQAIEIKVEAYPEDKFVGEIIFIDSRIDESSRTVLVTAKLSNPQFKLRQGMFANLNLSINAKQKAIIIPETALILKEDDVEVYTIEADNTVALKSVKIGIRFAGFVEVTDGLQEGEVVIIEGFQKIIPRAKVDVRFESKEEIDKIYQYPQTTVPASTITLIQSENK